MVKLESPDTSRIATEDALPARLVDQDALQAVAPPHSALHPTPLAAIVPTALSDKAGLAMVLTSGDQLARSIPRTTPAPGVGLQLVLPHPVADRRQTAVQALCNLPQRQTSGKQPLHLLFRGRSRSCMLPPLRRSQTVLLQPVADRRFVFAYALADRFEGHSLGQALFQELLLHGCIISIAADSKLR